jgi:hypothetical protein
MAVDEPGDDQCSKEGTVFFQNLNKSVWKWILKPNFLPVYIQGRIQKFLDWVDNEINNNNKHLLRSNTKGYGGKTH